MWVYVIDYYERFNLREWDIIEIERKDEPVNKEKDKELQNILYEFIRTPDTGETYEDKVKALYERYRLSDGEKKLRRLGGSNSRKRKRFAEVFTKKLKF